MANKFTNAQRDAVESRGSVIVSAAAGSGKTTVLVERVMSIIAPCDENDVVPIDRLLIVTFTNAAAAEMKARIERALFEKIKANPQKDYLNKQKHLLGFADICTIDSFCVKFVRENFSVLGVSPDFSVSAGAELDEKKSELLQKLLKPHYEEHSDAFDLALQLAGCEYNESNLCNLINELYRQAMLSPDIDLFFDNLIAPYNNDFAPGHPWYDYAMNKAAEIISVLKSEVGELAEITEQIVDNQKYQDYTSDAAGVIEILEYAYSKGYDDLKERIAEADFNVTIRNNSPDEAKKAFTVCKNSLKDHANELKDIFLYSSKDIEEMCKRIRPAVGLIIDLCRELIKGYFEICKEENIFTFEICEQLTYRALTGKYGEEGLVTKEYQYVMVDEYQDVNNLQDAIFTTISNKGENLFVVGDVKQSIYAFRGSNPENFIKKEKTQKRNIFLSENFRSRSEVCDAVNFFFKNLLNGSIGSVIYGENEKLKPGAEFPEVSEEPVEMLLVNNSETEAKRFESESEAIADYIEDVLKQGKIIKVDNTTLREAQYGDIAILMRGLKKVDVLADVLHKRGIPVTYSGEAFINTYEIKLLISLLKVINNPKSDVDLATVLLSPLFGFTSDELAIMRTADKRCSVYTSVINSAKSGDIKSEEFIKTLDEYRRVFFTNTLSEAVNRLYALSGITDIVSLMPSGDAKVSNLRYFAKLVADFSSRSTGGIYAFLNYINNLPENFFTSGITGESGVKIITMHKSKGLQFPICILANLTNQLTRKDYTSRVLYDEELGIGFRYFDDEKEEICLTPNIKPLSEKAKSKRSEEELRILYVATTRAQDKLCIVLSLDNPESTLKNTIQKLDKEPPYIGKEALNKMNKLSDFFLYAAVLNRGFSGILNSYGLESPFITDDCELKVRVVNAGENNKEPEEKAEIEPLHDPALEKQILENFEYKYPFESLSRIESKVSVSRLANGEEAERFAFTAKPSFMIEGGMTAAETGTALHHVMQYISFEDGIDVESEIERLKEWRYITEPEANAVSIPAIKEFFRSDIFKAIKESPDVRREMRFLTEVPVKDIDANADVPEGTGVLIQGAVDLCFVENESVTVLDFKTDRVENMEILKERYFEQLSIYSKACEKVFAMPVSKRIIYSFHLSDYIVF